MDLKLEKQLTLLKGSRDPQWVDFAKVLLDFDKYERRPLFLDQEAFERLFALHAAAWAKSKRVHSVPFQDASGDTCYFNDMIRRMSDDARARADRQQREKDALKYLDRILGGAAVASGLLVLLWLVYLDFFHEYYLIRLRQTLLPIIFVWGVGGFMVYGIIRSTIGDIERFRKAAIQAKLQKKPQTWIPLYAAWCLLATVLIGPRLAFELLPEWLSLGIQFSFWAHQKINKR